MDRQGKTIYGSGTKSGCLDILTGLHAALFVTEYHKRTLKELSCPCNTRTESTLSVHLYTSKNKNRASDALFFLHIFPVPCVFTLLSGDSIEMDNIKIRLLVTFYELHIRVFKDNFFSHDQKVMTF